MILVFFAMFALVSADTTITLINKCPHTIWPGLWGSPQPSIKGLKIDGNQTLKQHSKIQTLLAGKSIPIKIPTNWNAGRIWARTGCTGKEGSTFKCQTGDCGNRIQCQVTGEKPATVAEWTMNGAGGQAL